MCVHVFVCGFCRVFSQIHSCLFTTGKKQRREEIKKEDKGSHTANEDLSNRMIYSFDGFKKGFPSLGCRTFSWDEEEEEEEEAKDEEQS